MSATHTPGPWKTEVLGHTLRVTESQYETDNNDVCIMGDCTSKRHQANARLIAAAPDLLAELVETHSELHKIEAFLPDGAMKDRLHDRLLSIRAAIAKATEGAK